MIKKVIISILGTILIGVLIILAGTAFLSPAQNDQPPQNSNENNSFNIEVAENADIAPSAAFSAVATPAKKKTAAGNTASSTSRSVSERLNGTGVPSESSPSRKVVYLTFDDGPSPNTPNILRILDEYGVCATWFVKGNQLEFGYVKDIWNAGNQVAVHTFTHDYKAIYASASAFQNDVDTTMAKITENLGVAPKITRFPGGSYNGYNKGLADTLINQLREGGYRYYDWNISSGDGADHDAAFICNYVVEQAGGRDGKAMCVLMHDSAAKNTTVEALPQIIEWYIDHGYTFDVLMSNSPAFEM